MAPARGGRWGSDAVSKYEIIGPLAYQGKADCQNATCRVMPNGYGGYRCMGWHCSYCDAPTGDQGHRCDASDAILGEARRQAQERGQTP